MHRGFFSQVTQESLHQKVSEALEWVGWTDKVKRDSTVFVKPNFTWPKFRPGVVTSPEFLSNLLPLLKDRAARVIVGESDLPIFRASRGFKGMGIDKICEKAGAEMVGLSQGSATSVDTEGQRRKVRSRLPKLTIRGVS